MISSQAAGQQNFPLSDPQYAIPCLTLAQSTLQVAAQSMYGRGGSVAGTIVCSASAPTDDGTISDGSQLTSHCPCARCLKDLWIFTPMPAVLPLQAACCDALSGCRRGRSEQLRVGPLVDLNIAACYLMFFVDMFMQTLLFGV